MPRGPLPCDGGPLDGHAVLPTSGKYTWISRKLTTHAGDLRPLPGQRPVFSVGGAPAGAPRDGCALYRRDGDRLVYAGHSAYLCADCGCYHGRAEGGREKRPCALSDDA